MTKETKLSPPQFSVDQDLDPGLLLQFHDAAHFAVGNAVELGAGHAPGL